MIDRYSRDQMKKVWSEINKYDKWLEVEISVCQAWYQQGVIPKPDIEKLERCNYDFEILFVLGRNEGNQSRGTF
mgnify:CR=1 FL=1